VKTRRFAERLGATREGLLRNERIMPDGRKRNALLYSLVDDEWAGVKRFLEQRLGIG
jgi:RimJ/RimL family protein N-acetyltransferase